MALEKVNKSEEGVTHGLLSGRPGRARSKTTMSFIISRCVFYVPSLFPSRRPPKPTGSGQVVTSPAVGDLTSAGGALFMAHLLFQLILAYGKLVQGNLRHRTDSFRFPFTQARVKREASPQPARNFFQGVAEGGILSPLEAVNPLVHT